MWCAVLYRWWILSVKIKIKKKPFVSAAWCMTKIYVKSVKYGTTTTHTHQFNSHLPGEPGLARCSLRGHQRKPRWDSVKDDNKRFGLSWKNAQSRRKWWRKLHHFLWDCAFNRDILDTIPPCLPRTSSWFSSFHFHHCRKHQTVNII